MVTDKVAYLIKTSRPMFFFVIFLPDFLSVEIFRIMWSTLAHFFRRKHTHTRPKVRPWDGHVEDDCKISASISKRRRGHLDF